MSRLKVTELDLSRKREEEAEVSVNEEFVIDIDFKLSAMFEFDGRLLLFKLRMGERVCEGVVVMNV